MEQSNDTRVIYFSDLFFAVLYAWRKILVVALAFAVLFGGVQTARILMAHNMQPESPSEEHLEEIADLEEKIAATQIRIDSLTHYMQNAEFVQMNPYQVHQATANIYVEAETPELTASVLWAYQAFLRSYVYDSKVANTLGCLPDYLGELVACQIVDNTDCLLNITVSYSDADGVEKFLSVLLDGVSDATTQISQDIAPHTIRIISYSPTQKHSSNMLAKQEEYQTSLSTLELNLKTYQEQLDQLNKIQVETFRDPVIAAVLGAVVGVVIIVCFTLIRHFVTDKVYSARTLQNRTGIKVLGCMPDFGKRSKLDAKLRKLENRAYRPEQTAVTLASVSYHCQDLKNLLVLGTYDSSALAALQEALVADGIAVIDGKHVLYNIAGANALSDCDAVLLLETCDQSRYTDVSRAMEMIEDRNKQLVGCILLGG